MKKSYALAFFLLLTMQSVMAERREHFLRTLCIDLKAFIQGNASEEQKDRLVKQAAAMILAGSIALYCVVIFGARRDGEKVPLPLKQLAGLVQRGMGSGGEAEADQSGPPPPIALSDSMRNLFEQPAPSPFSALRNAPPARLPRLKSFVIKGPRGRRLPSA